MVVALYCTKSRLEQAWTRSGIQKRYDYVQDQIALYLLHSQPTVDVMGPVQTACKNFLILTPHRETPPFSPSPECACLSRSL